MHLLMTEFDCPEVTLSESSGQSFFCLPIPLCFVDKLEKGFMYREVLKCVCP